jgi:nitrite reductase (NO-forming)
MNNVVLTGTAACLLIAGLIFSPVFIKQSYVAHAQGQLPFQARNFGDCGDPRTTITKKVTLIAKGVSRLVFPDNAVYPGGIMYDADTFNGTIPGPLISLTQGENLNVTLINEDNEVHSLDFHMGYGTDLANSGPVPGTAVIYSLTGEKVLQPGQSRMTVLHGLVPFTHTSIRPIHTPNSTTWRICNPAPGAWFYHCSGDMLNGIWRHIANGMYGGVVVHPLSEKPAKEFYMVFGQLFTDNTHGIGNQTDNRLGEFSLPKFINDQPDVIMTNGGGFKYVPSIGTGPMCKGLGLNVSEDCTLPLNKTATPFKVYPNNLTRWYIFNAGPNDGVSFHFIGTYQNDSYGFDPAPIHNIHVCPGPRHLCPGQIKLQDMNDQVNWIPPAGGQVIEAKFPPLNPQSQNHKVNASLYIGVDHNMNHVLKGGAFLVNATTTARAGDQPTGTWVPPKDPNPRGIRHIHCVSSEQQGKAACPYPGYG